MLDGYLSFESQTFSLQQGTVTRVLRSVMFCCYMNIKRKESFESYNNFIYVLS